MGKKTTQKKITLTISKPLSVKRALGKPDQIGSFDANDIDMEIHRHWASGKRKEALAKAKQLAADQTSKKHMVQYATYLYLSEQPSEAIAIYRDVDRLFGSDPKIIHAVSAAYAQNKEYANAIGWALKILPDYPNDISLNSILAQSWGCLGEMEKAKHHGEVTLITRDSMERRQDILKDFTLPDVASENVLKRLAMKKVVSFSLFGSNQRYLRGALHNVLLGMELFPDWKMRFYLDASVPGEFIALLKELDCEVVMEEPGQSAAQKLCWRFKVADDPTVGRYMVRDCDSVFSAREVGTVREWMESGKLFHIIRDWHTHTELMLAGLWGGVAGVLPNMQTLIGDFFKRYNISSLNIDQIFLAKYLWPVIKPSCYISDGLFRCLGAHPIKCALSEDEQTIGKNRHAVEQIKQANFLKAWIEKYPCLGVMPVRTIKIPTRAKT